MTIQSSLSKALYYGDGNSVNFAFNFKVFNAGQITVTVADNEGHYGIVDADSISLNNDGTGTVVYTLDESPLPEGYTLAITRNMDFLQEKSFSNAAKFDAAVVEDALDQACAERQQMLEKIERAVIMPSTSTETPEEVVANTLKARDDAANSASAAATSETNAATSEQAASETASSMASSLESAVTTAVSDATALATASASAAATSEANAAASETAAANSAITAQTWAESDTPPDPDDAESKSAKTWALSAAANVPIASTTYAGKVMASASLQVNQKTGEATVPVATETVAGIVTRATLEEAQAGENIDKYLAPMHIADINTAIANAQATGQIGNVAISREGFNFNTDSDDLASGTYFVWGLVTHPSGATGGGGLLYHQVTVNGYTQLFVSLNPPNVLYSRVKHLGTLFGWQKVLNNSSAIVPNYSAGVSKAFDTVYTADVAGLVVAEITASNGYAKFIINGQNWTSGTTGGESAIVSFPVCSGQTYKVTKLRNPGTPNPKIVFYPYIGG